MQLLYLKILKSPSHKSLHFLEQDLNFSGEHLFYRNDKGTFIYRRKEDYFQNLYGNDTRITAIVGSNGMGKTTLLRFLQFVIARLQDREENHYYDFDHWEWIALIEKNGLQQVETRAKRDGSGQSVFPTSISIKGYQPSKRSKTSASMYYSPHFELDEPSFSDPDYIDVSFDRLFYNANNKLESDTKDISPILNFRWEEVKRQIDLVQHMDKNSADSIFNTFLPNRIQLSFWQYSAQFNNGSKYISQQDGEIYQWLDKNFLQRDKQLKKRAQEEDKEARAELAQLWFYRRVLEILFTIIENRPEPKGGDRENSRLAIQPKSLIFYKGGPVAKILSAFRTYIQLVDYSVVPELEELQKYIETTASLLAKSTEHTSDNGVIINLDKAKELIPLEKNILGLLPFQSEQALFNFNWPNLSTGEKAYLNLFSRLYYGYNQYKSPYSSIDNAKIIYFLIDEPATGFHPQWQKEYLHKLTQFLESLVPEKKHLIITTHSPYLVSDLQKEDVIRLHSQTMPEREIRENTFGANIHELLANSFYLQDGFMGDLARIRIASLINFLDSKDVETREWDQIKAKRLIHIIGEPLLKQDLWELYHQKFSSLEELDKQIRILQDLKRNRRKKD